MARITIAIFSLTALCFSSCAWVGLNSSSSDSAPISDGAADSSQLPFRLEVDDEVNDGTRLHVLGSIVANADWNTSEVVIRLTGLSGGNPSTVAYLPLQRLRDAGGSEGSVRAGAKHSFSLSVDARNITDYQLELLWGKDAQQILKQIGEGSSGSVEIRNIEVTTFKEQCGPSGCMYHHKISGKLHNATGEIISRVVLGVGFIHVVSDSQLDLSRQIPENEERIEVPGLNLAPGSARSLNLDIERRVTDPSLRPAMRIIAFE